MSDPRLTSSVWTIGMRRWLTPGRWSRPALRERGEAWHVQDSLKRRGGRGRVRRVVGGLLVATLATAAAVVAVPTSASAAVLGLEYVWDMTEWNSSVYKSVRVFCPAGKQLIGGSFDIQGALGAVVLDDFIPSPGSLLVGAGEIVGPGEPSDGTTDSWQIVALAVCANPLPGYSIITRTSDLTQAPNQNIDAECPPSRRLIGGGASLSNGFGQVSIGDLLFGGGPNSSHPIGFVHAHASTDVDGYSGQWSVSAYAICADPLPGWRDDVEVGDVDNHLSKTTARYCPLGQVVIGVGWSLQPGALDGWADRYIAGAVISNDPDPGATTSAYSFVRGQPWNLVTQAVCVDS